MVLRTTGLPVAALISSRILIGCLHGERVVRAEIANSCDFDVNVRLGFREEGLAAVAPDDVASGQTDVVKAVYPGPNTPLLFAISPVGDDQRRIVLPEHARTRRTGCGSPWRSPYARTQLR